MTTALRPECDEDAPAVRELVRAAFGGDHVPRLVDALRGSVAWLDLSFVAVEQDEVVGHVSYTRGWVDLPRTLLDVLVLSPLSVRPDRQRAGIGSLLVRGSIALITQERSEPLVFLEGDPGYYRRLGFVAAGGLGFTSPSVRIPEAAFQVVPLDGYDDSMRGALIYPDVFWRHDSVGLRPEA